MTEPIIREASKYLCDICNSIFADGSYDWWNSWYNSCSDGGASPITTHAKYLPHHTSYQSWCDAVAKRCWICSKLPYPRQTGDDEPLELVTYRLYRDDDSISYTLHFENCSEVEDATFGIDAVTVQPDLCDTTLQLHYFADASRAQQNTGDEAVAKLTKAWANFCLHYHQSCSKLIDHSWRPTRLLEVLNNSIRLIDSFEEGISNPYATLSHCWGTKPFFVLTINTMAQLRTGLPYQSFPTTFRHAFITLRRLGLLYIWIDCYCIIQGPDPEARAD